MNNERIAITLSAQHIVTPLVELRDQTKDSVAKVGVMIKKCNELVDGAKRTRLEMPLIGQRQKLLFMVEDTLNATEEDFRRIAADYERIIARMQMSARQVIESNPFHREQGLSLILEIETDTSKALEEVAAFLETLEVKRAELLIIE